MDNDRTLVFAAVSGSPGAEGFVAQLCNELTRALARPIISKLVPSYPALEHEVLTGHAHVVWAPPLVAIHLEDAGLVTIELCSARGGQVDYHAALFTRHASRIAKPADLKGCHVAWVDKASSAGYLVPRLKLASLGLNPDALFGRESFLKTHEQVCCAVLAGEADAGATYLSIDPKSSQPVSAGWLEAGAGINGAFIIDIAGPIPSDAIVMSNRVHPDLKARLTEELRKLPESVPDAIFGLLRADGFAPPKSAHFEALRRLVLSRQ